MMVSVIERVGRVSILVVLVACSGGGGEATEAEGSRGPRWSVTASYEPEGVAIPEVVLWAAEADGEFQDPVFNMGVQTWSASGALTVTRWPSRQAAENECYSTVSPDSQVVTLDDVNTQVVLFLADEEPFYSATVWTSFSYERTVTCPSGDTMTAMLDDRINWLEIPRTLREGEQVMIQGTGSINGAARSWTLAKTEQ
jgi:hypothetical protein